jgi:predicted dehydrogenase
MEKPISHTLDGVIDAVTEASASGLVFMVGYTYRFWPPLIKAREILHSGALGRPLSTSITFSQYLPDWHP